MYTYMPCDLCGYLGLNSVVNIKIKD